MLKVGIVGGTGYTGVELVRLLSQHPKVQLQAITSRAEAGKKINQLYPNLRGYSELEFSLPTQDALKECELVFFATPHGVAHSLAGAVLQQGASVIDLSADFRLRDADVWAKWYNQPHGAPELLPEAVYGLPEHYREQIKSTRLVAVPGCYPTSIQLGLMPLLKHNLLTDDYLIADCKTGLSGAGRGLKLQSLYCESNDNFSAYAVTGHRHLPEINQELACMGSLQPKITFTPHLTPMSRGIHATLYMQANKTELDVQTLFEQFYANEPFVDVLPAGSYPQTASVRGSNMCRLAVHHKADGQIIVLSVIDNLLKGASGQAVQNMNIMFGFAETEGLEHIALMP